MCQTARIFKNPSSLDISMKKIFVKHLKLYVWNNFAVAQANLLEGYIIMAAGCAGDVIEEQAYLITCDDIIRMRMKVKLVVLSCGMLPSFWIHNQTKLQTLATAFLIAGKISYNKVYSCERFILSDSKQYQGVIG